MTEQHWAEYRALGSPRAQCGGAGDDASDQGLTEVSLFRNLGSRGGHTQQVQLSNKLLGKDCVEC